MAGTILNLVVVVRDLNGSDDVDGHKHLVSTQWFALTDKIFR